MRLPLSLCLLALAPAASAQERPSKPVPSLARAPKLDGVLRDFGGGAPLKSAATPDASASFTGKVAWRKDVLYVGLEAKDDVLTGQDSFTVSLFFPGGGATATGFTWRLGADGQRPAGAALPTPSFAQGKVEAGARAAGGKLAVEAAIPARAFPRLPAREPLVFELCVTYEDKDPEGTPQPVSNCSGGAMVGEALRLPDDFLKGLKLKLPERVVVLEAAPKGWLGSDLLQYPAWLQADEPLTAPLLGEMVAMELVDPEKAGLGLPRSLMLPDARTLLPLVAGKNPYATAGRCDADKELRLALYLVSESTALRVLDWPAATCALGRAEVVSLDEEGTLTIRYSNGATINFVWGGERFERTELGRR